MMTKVKRGPSKASKDAARYLLKHPGTTAQELAEKFGINVTTIYRATWWKARAQQEESWGNEGSEPQQ